MALTVADVRQAIAEELNELLAEADLPPRVFVDDDVLLETGLDSLALAVLVARLEDRLDYDPFTEMEEPVYPQTIGELSRTYTGALKSR